MRNSTMLKQPGMPWTGGLLFLIGMFCFGPTGCDEVMSGQYIEANGWGRMEFDGQTVYVTTAIVGSTFAATYDVQGDHVIVDGAAGPQSFHIRSDGSLQDGKGLRFVRR